MKQRFEHIIRQIDAGPINNADNVIQAELEALEAYGWELVQVSEDFHQSAMVRLYFKRPFQPEPNNQTE